MLTSPSVHISTWTWEETESLNNLTLPEISFAEFWRMLLNMSYRKLFGGKRAVLFIGQTCFRDLKWWDYDFGSLLSDSPNSSETFSTYILHKTCIDCFLSRNVLGSQASWKFCTDEQSHYMANKFPWAIPPHSEKMWRLWRCWRCSPPPPWNPEDWILSSQLPEGHGKPRRERKASSMCKFVAFHQPQKEFRAHSFLYVFCFLTLLLSIPLKEIFWEINIQTFNCEIKI